jgi:hypothetical protein
LTVNTSEPIVVDGWYLHPEYAERYRSENLREPAAMIEEWMKDSVGFLFNKAERPGQPKMRPVGTCFFVTMPDQHGNGPNFLVTAKHVQADLKKKAFVRLNKKEFTPSADDWSGVEYLPLPTYSKDWIFPDDSAIDLAAILWSPMETNLRIQFLDDKYLERGCKLSEPGATPSNISWPPKEGDEVVFIAMMAPYTGRDRNYPAVRYGKIALRTDEPIPNGPLGFSEYRVIDAQIYPGHSGSPVWALYQWTQAQSPGPTLQRVVRSAERTAFPLGVLSGGWPVKEELARTKKKGRDETEAYYKLGIALVTPIEKVLEFLRSPKVKAIINRKQGESEYDVVPL